MPVWLQIGLGLGFLTGGASLLVRGAAWVALVLGVRPLVVGLTVVAFGTSAPELVASLAAASTDGHGIAMGTVLGSNLANILLILGLVASIRPIRRLAQRIVFESNYLILMTVLTAVPFVFGGQVTRAMGAVLVLLLLLFTWQLISRERKAAKSAAPVRPGVGAAAVGSNILFLILGILGLRYGGTWLVDGARTVALDVGMSEVLVGMTVVAVGTSLPELAASVAAARQGQPELCLGNILGSNIFNIGMVLGITAAIHPLPVSWSVEGAPMVAGLLAMAVLVLILFRYRGLPRWTGPVLLSAYVGYLAFEVLRM